MKGSVLVLALAAVLTIGLTQAANGDAQFFYTADFQAPNTIVYQVIGLPYQGITIPVDGGNTGCVTLSGNPPDIVTNSTGDGSAQVTINAGCNPTGGQGTATIRIYDPKHLTQEHWTEITFNVTWSGGNPTISFVSKRDWTSSGPKMVPATGTIGLIVLLCLIAGAGFWYVRRRNAAVA